VETATKAASARSWGGSGLAYHVPEGQVIGEGASFIRVTLRTSQCGRYA
jgi:hypothetical protein